MVWSLAALDALLPGILPLEPTVNWLLIGDAPQPEDLPRNVRLKQVTFDDYRALFSKKLGVGARWTDVYKLCDLKPALAACMISKSTDYDYWAIATLTYFWRYPPILHPQILVHDLVTTHADILSGHFTLFRNSPRMVNAFRGFLSGGVFLTLRDTRALTNRFFSPFSAVPTRRLLGRLFTRHFLAEALCVERYSTNIPPRTWIDGSADWPEKWFWERGRLTTNGSGDQEFLVPAFLLLAVDRWTSEAVAPWKRLERLDALPPGGSSAFTISARGFTPD